MDILIEQEVLLHNFETRTNEGKVSRLIHPEFQEVGKSGRTFGYESIIQAMKAENLSNSKVHSQDFEIIELAPTAYLLLYQSAIVDEFGEVSNHAKRSSIWVKSEHSWMLRYHQGTPCQEFEVRE